MTVEEDTNPSNLKFSVQEQEGELECKLSFASLSLDNVRILLNDEPYYPVRLPTSLFVKNKSDEERLKIVKDTIFEGCTLHKVDEISDENVTRCAKEVVRHIDERERARAAASL
ncbi:MAG TPA: hypothetical protein VE544_05050 [Nitrososphaeraceae archaeon]|nr:hypothetical protein [Nitrososphaeraceae archaeon]